MKTLKLTVFEADALSKKEMSKVLGGNVCGCGCPGPSSTAANGNANVKGNKYTNTSFDKMEIVVTP
ncbi:MULTISPECIES: TIGR04149 family rSAM-modified RiPP [Bacteroides]|jgi:natural product precursor|uniref:TIGR04149 family rSAM-modified RiPP n=1 Tax=Bacteroides TaxID=816 RepID=UPI000E4EEB20|nr:MULTISPECIES: TIGR04149 family rSAM-modified RiPP [Bacteroides]RHL02432.1 rSAM-modified peptide [Bacteroides sp. AF39-11AC]